MSSITNVVLQNSSRFFDHNSKVTVLPLRRSFSESLSPDKTATLDSGSEAAKRTAALVFPVPEYPTHRQRWVIPMTLREHYLCLCASPIRLAKKYLFPLLIKLTL